VAKTGIKVETNITSLQNDLVKHLVKVGGDRKYRYQQRSVIIEGKKLVDEACSKHAVKHLLLLPGKPVPKGINRKKVVHVTERVMKKISRVIASDGSFAEIDMPPQADLSNKKFIIALDKISDRL